MSFRPQAILEFREAADQPVRQHPTVDLPADELKLALDLIFEELLELAESFGMELQWHNPEFDEYESPVGEQYRFSNVSSTGEELPEPDVIAAGDALGDLLVVVEQLGPTLGMNTDSLFAEVHRSNMSKVDPATGKMPKKPNGKAGKGPNFTEPDIERALLEYPIGMEVQGEGIDYECDFVFASSAAYAKREVPLSWPTLHALQVITPMDAARGLDRLFIRNVYVLPGMTSSPDWESRHEAILAAQQSSNLGGKIYELKR